MSICSLAILDKILNKLFLFDMLILLFFFNIIDGSYERRLIPCFIVIIVECNLPDQIQLGFDRLLTLLFNQRTNAVEADS